MRNSTVMADIAASADRLQREDPNTLSAYERDILDFETRQWIYSGSKEGTIRTTFDIPAPVYYWVLNRLLDDPAALAHNPVLVNRLRRLRDARRQARRLGDPTATHPTRF